MAIHTVDACGHGIMLMLNRGISQIRGGMKMKNIENHYLNKYGSDAYEKVVFDIYLNKASNNYCFAFTAIFDEKEDEERDYLLSCLLENYQLNCTEYHGQVQCFDGIDKSVVEVETLSDDVQDLIKILNFSTIVSKEIYNVSCFGYDYIVKKYCIGRVTYNGIMHEIPVYGYRSDFDGKYNFEVLYPEIQVKKEFEKGFIISNTLNDNAVLKCVIVKDRFFYIVFSVGETDHALKYSMSNFVEIVDSI